MTKYCNRMLYDYDMYNYMLKGLFVLFSCIEVHSFICFLFVLLCHAQCVNLFITCLNKKIRKVETKMSSSDAHIFMIFFPTHKLFSYINSSS